MLITINEFEFKWDVYVEKVMELVLLPIPLPGLDGISEFRNNKSADDNDDESASEHETLYMCSVDED